MLKPSERTTTETFKGRGSKPPKSIAATAVPTKTTQGPSVTTRKLPPGSGDATGPGNPVDVKVKKPPVLARDPSKNVSRMPGVQDMHREGGEGVHNSVLQTLPALPPLFSPIGGNKHPNHEVTQVVGGGTADGSRAGCMYPIFSLIAALQPID